jgi:hypothetical protein
MIAVAERFADELHAETGLATWAYIEEHLTHSSVVLTTRPNSRRPGDWLHYANEDLDRGVIELVVYIPPGEEWVTFVVKKVQREYSSIHNRMVIGSEIIPFPLPQDLAMLETGVSRVCAKLGYSCKRGPFLF